MKSYNIISIERQQKYLLYHRVNYIYEYLTGEDILPSNQQQIIEQTKFTYSPLGKAFDKQVKTIEDQGKKQVDALNTLKSDNKITIKKYIYDPNDTPFISRQKEIFNKLID